MFIFLLIYSNVFVLCGNFWAESLGNKYINKSELEQKDVSLADSILSWKSHVAIYFSKSLSLGPPNFLQTLNIMYSFSLF